MIDSDQALLIAQSVLSAELFGINAGDIARPGLLLIMFTMGLALRMENFRQLFVQPLPVSVGLAGQLVLLPVVTFTLVGIFSPPTPVAIGAIILSCCPGAASSNYFTYLAGGDIALSVVLTAVSGFIVVFTTPLLINLGLTWFSGAGQVIVLPVVQTMYEIFVLLVLPVVAGMALRNWLGPKYADLLRRITSGLAFIGLVLVVVLAFVSVIDHIPVLVVLFGPLALAVNAINMSAGYLAAKTINLGEGQKRSVTLEIGIQNFLLAIVISLNILNVPEFTVFAITYLFIMYITGFTFIAYCRLLADRKLSTATAV